MRKQFKEIGYGALAACKNAEALSMKNPDF